MENEKRLIEADAFLQWLVKRFKCIPLVGSCDNDSESMKLLLAQAPTVDAVEVVRCEECLAGLEDGFICSGSGLMPAHQTFPGKFCSYGKRRC